MNAKEKNAEQKNANQTHKPNTLQTLKQDTHVMRCNSRDDLHNFSFILKMSIFSEVYLESSQWSMMERFLQK